MDWASFLKRYNLVHNEPSWKLLRHRGRRKLLNLLARERIRRRIYLSRDEARQDVFDYI